MPVSYQKNKAHIYKWREGNIDALRAVNRKSERKRQAWKREAKTFLNILLENFN
jgi:endonuclease YncB( thermonuclease family)